MLGSRLLVLVVVSCSGCAGVSVRPDHASAAALPTASLSADSARERDRLVEAAIAAVGAEGLADAERLAREALELDPRLARARAVLGTVLFRRSRASDPPDLFLAHAGEAELRLGEELAPGDPLVGWLHAVMLAEAGHVSAAAATAEAALRQSEAAPAAERATLLGAAGTYRYELGEERAALPHLQGYLALRPDDAEAQFRLGYCLLRIAALPSGPKPTSLVVARNQAEAAVEAFRRGSELAPGDADVALAVGAALLRVADLSEQLRDPAARDGRLADAGQCFQLAADTFPGSAEAQFGLGVVAERRGNAEAAREAYTQALTRDPDHLGSLLNLAALQPIGAGADGAVRELLQRALAADERQPSLSADERRRITARLEPAPPAATRP